VRNKDVCRKCLACASVCPTHALTVEGETYDVDTLMAEISKDKDFYIKSGGGVTLSGGEPLLQKDFALEFINALRKEKYNVGIETSGYAEPDDFREVVDRLDFLYIDFKHPDSSEHKKMTDVSNEKILNNIKYAAASGMDMAVRIPVIPHFNDTKEVAQKYCEILSPLHIPQVHLLPFHQMGKAKWEALGIPYLYKDEPGLHNEDMEPLAEIFRKNGFCVQIGG